MPHDTLLLAGENRLTYSDWNASGWNCTANDGMAYPALGVDGEARAVVNDDNTITYINMAQTWVASGTLRTIIEADFTGATNVCFWIEQGVQQRESHITHQLQMGTCDKNGANQQEWYNQTVTGNGRRWFSVPLSGVTLDPDKICFYVTLTDLADGHSYWYAQMAGASDSLAPGTTNYKTSGAPVIYATDSVQRITLATCPKCREKVFAYRNLRGKARKETDPVIPPDTWES